MDGGGFMNWNAIWDVGLKNNLFFSEAAKFLRLNYYILLFLGTSLIATEHKIDASWGGWLSNFTINGTQTPAINQTRFKMRHDNANIYFDIEAYESHMSSLKAAKYAHGSDAIWQNDSIELNFCLSRNTLEYYKILIDNCGTVVGLKMVDDNTGSRTFIGQPWDSFATAQVRKSNNRWHLQVKVPFGSMDIAKLEEWRINVARNRYAGGKAVHSSYSRLYGISHIRPWDFIKVKMLNFSTDGYLWEIENIQNKVINANTLTLAFDVRNNNREFRRFVAQCGNKKNSSYVEAKKYKRVSMNIPVKNHALNNFTLQLRSASGQLMHTRSFDFKIDYAPIKLQLIAPAYRNNIYASMKLKEVIVKVDAEKGLIKEELKISFPNGANIHTISPGELPKTIKFNVENLPDGKHMLRAESGEFVKTVQIRKLPYRQGEIYLDADGITYIDGKKFLPFGWFRVGPNSHVTGINAMQANQHNSSIKDMKKFLDLNLKRGKYAIIYPYSDGSGAWDMKNFARKERKSELTKSQQSQIRKFVGTVGRYNGILGWYVSDEPENTGDNPLWYEQLRKLLTEVDPYHPTILLNWGIAGINKYYQGCDILMPDCYPSFVIDGPSLKPIYAISQWTRTANKLRPTWITIHAFDWARKGHRTRPPTFRELRNQVYQVFANNGKGILMYSYTHWSQMFSDLRVGPNFLAGELQVNKDLLLASNSNSLLQVNSPDKNFQSALKRFGNDICIIAVNTSDKPITVGFELKQPVKKLYILSERKSVNGSRFSQRFEPFETKLFTNNKSIATACDIVDFRKKLAELKAAPKLKNNLLYIGEITHQQHMEFNKGNKPANLPTLTASSDIKHYYTLKTGGLYFLTDGIIENIPLFYMAWTPSRDDKQPYIEIKLPSRQRVSKVVVYATHAENQPYRISALSVSSGGKELARRENLNQQKIEITFSPVDTAQLRINILKQRKSEIANNNPAISEIEVYK